MGTSNSFAASRPSASLPTWEADTLPTELIPQSRTLAHRDRGDSYNAASEAASSSDDADEIPAATLESAGPIRTFIIGVLTIAGAGAVAVVVGVLALWSLDLAAERHLRLAVPSHVGPCVLAVPTESGTRWERREDCLVPDFGGDDADAPVSDAP